MKRTMKNLQARFSMSAACSMSKVPSILFLTKPSDRASMLSIAAQIQFENPD